MNSKRGVSFSLQWLECCTAKRPLKLQRLSPAARKAVLKYLENEARKRTGGKEGVYMVVADNSGTVLFIVVAGHTFSGGKVSIAPSDFPINDIQEIKFENGMAVEAVKTTN